MNKIVPFPEYPLVPNVLGLFFFLGFGSWHETITSLGASMQHSDYSATHMTLRQRNGSHPYSLLIPILRRVSDVLQGYIQGYLLGWSD